MSTTETAVAGSAASRCWIAKKEANMTPAPFKELLYQLTIYMRGCASNTAMDGSDPHNKEICDKGEA